MSPQKENHLPASRPPFTVRAAREAILAFWSSEGMLGPVNVDGKILKRGYTTGMCAAAAAKAATILLFGGGPVAEVEVATPVGIALTLAIHGEESGEGYARCYVRKDAGDDPDVTDGLAIWAEARRIPRGIRIKGGRGVGTVTRPGLAVPPGNPAINPVPFQVIQREVAGVLPAGAGVEITISVPGGEEVATKTMNARLGILGGISILGTTGVVEPMSEEAIKSSLALQISQALAQGHRNLILTPGRQGEKLAAERYGLPAEAVVQMSNFAGFMLKECARQGVERVLLFGHHGKLVKVAAGIFQTHSRVADGRLETIITHAALLGAKPEVIAEIWRSATAEETVEILQRHNLSQVFAQIAAVASRRSREYAREELAVGTVLVSLAGEILGMDAAAAEIWAQIASR